VKEQVREERLGNWIHSVISDCRYAARQLRKNAAAIMIPDARAGDRAATAIFSVVYGVLLRPLPFSQPDRLMAVFEVNSRGTWSRLADPNFVSGKRGTSGGQARRGVPLLDVFSDLF